MKIGCVKEIKLNESRVGLTPDAVKTYIDNKHVVYIEKDAGLASGFSNEAYIKNGAIILDTAKEVWLISNMIVKVKEPLKEEYIYFRKDLIIYTYLHLAANEELTKALLANKVTSIAYETITDETGLPCLRPMSEVAGKLSVLEGVKFLTSIYGGKGILISGTTSVDAANVLIIGAGTSGKAALDIAYHLGAKTTILDINVERLKQLQELYPKLYTDISNEENISKYLNDADLVVSAVLLPGAKAPKLIKRAHYKNMKPGIVIVDIAIDQGGSLEMSHPTTHDDPIFVCDGIIHYCVSNMPGIVPKTSTLALNHETIKYGLLIANDFTHALNIESIVKGINTYKGYVTIKAVADTFNLPFKEIKDLK